MNTKIETPVNGASGFFTQMYDGLREVVRVREVER